MANYVQHKQGKTTLLNALCFMALWLAVGIISVSSLSCARAESPSAVVIFADGKPEIYLDASFADFCKAVQPQDFAVVDAPGDLVRCFKLLTGVDLPTEPGDGRIPLRLRLLDWQEDRGSADPLGHQGYLLEVSDNEIVLSAPRGIGVYNAIYNVLDQWGCRWIMPGDDGEIIPRKARLELPIGTFRKNKSMDARCTTGATADYNGWKIRNGAGTVEWLPMSHYWPTMVPEAQYFKDHPEYFAMVGGKRVPLQLETANPELIALLIEKSKQWLRADPSGMAGVPMEFNDNSYYSMSPESLALDPPDNPNYDGKPSMSDRLVILANQVGEAIEKEFPDKLVSTLAYSHHTLPPIKAIPRPNVSVAVCRSGCCGVHLTPRPQCSKSLTYWDTLAGWLKVCRNVYTYDWVPTPWNGDLPCPLFLEYPRALKKAYAMGVKGNLAEKGLRSDAANFVDCYLEWRIKADPSREPEAELKELCEVFFGPAGVAMNRYYLALAKAADTNFPGGDCFNYGSALLYLDLYTPGIISEAKTQLDAAAAAAADNADFSRRVKMVRLTFDYLHAFLNGAWEAKKGNYDASVAAYDSISATLAELNAMNPKYIHTGNAGEWTATARGKILARYFPDRLGLIRSWQLLGPLDNHNHDSDLLDGLFPPKLFPEGGRVGQPIKLAGGTTLNWKPYTSPEGLVEFTSAFAGVKKDWGVNSHAYAALTVQVPADQAVQLLTGSFFPFRVFVNGAEVFHKPGHGVDRPDQRIIPVTLKAGRNEIVVRSSGGKGNPAFRWGFYFRITGPDGNPLPDL